jgi:hypothetical protein
MSMDAYGPGTWVFGINSNLQQLYIKASKLKLYVIEVVKCTGYGR